MLFLAFLGLRRLIPGIKRAALNCLAWLRAWWELLGAPPPPSAPPLPRPVTAPRERRRRPLSTVTISRLAQLDQDAYSRQTTIQQLGRSLPLVPDRVPRSIWASLPYSHPNHPSPSSGRSSPPSSQEDIPVGIPLSRAHEQYHRGQLIPRPRARSLALLSSDCWQTGESLDPRIRSQSSPQ